MTMPKHLQERMKELAKKYATISVHEETVVNHVLHGSFIDGFTAMYEIAAERERKLIKLLKDIQELGFVTYPSDLRSYFRGPENPVYIKAMDYNKRKDNIVSELDQVLKELESG